MTSIPEPLRISPRISVLPIIHGSAQCALLVRKWLLEYHFDCVALPLPESFREPVEEAVLRLPRPAIVIQPKEDQGLYTSDSAWAETSEVVEEEDEEAADYEEDWWPLSYVPIDPCQPVIMGIRAALGEHLPRAYVDLETEQFLPDSSAMPDPYALKTVAPERFAAALLPSIPAPTNWQTRARVRHMARRLRGLEQKYERVLLISSVSHWPWIRAAYRALLHEEQIVHQPLPHDLEVAPELMRITAEEEPVELSPDEVEPPQIHAVDPRTLVFLFGELPFITALHERARSELEDDDNLQIDGVKELLIAAREAYRRDLGKRARKISPFALSQCLKYIRNLSLLARRMTPDLYTIVTAAKQMFGDQFALHVVETARSYSYADTEADEPQVVLGIDQGRLPGGDLMPLVSRLPGPSIVWQSVQLNRRPTEAERKRWQYRWNPFGQCSYPPEDERIERFRSRAFERAQAVMGADLAQTEKFTTSVKDGIDIRDTVRHWYEKQIYVKVIPPSRGTLDACVMLFDSPADPRDYPWRTTWFAEHHNESTLAFYATDFRRELVGPGICAATYGGTMFLYPPRSIPDIWVDKRLDFAETLEERLLAAACLYSRSRQIALVSPLPPGGGWKRLARRFRKQLVHVPLSGFSEAEVSQLRIVHVLNGKEVRSYAEHFIRRS
jgi:hypothetical protein